MKHKAKKMFKGVATGLLAGSLFLGASNMYSPKENLEETIITTIGTGNEKRQLNIDKNYYLTEKNKPNTGNIVSSLFEHTASYDSPIIQALNDYLHVPSGNKEKDAQTIIDFVHQQKSIPDMIDYTKSPIETIVEGGGDCEDLSVLAYSMMKNSGLNPLYVTLNANKDNAMGHVLIAVEGDFQGEYVTYEDKKYYLAEPSTFDVDGEHIALDIGQFPIEDVKNEYGFMFCFQH